MTGEIFHDNVKRYLETLALRGLEVMAGEAAAAVLAKMHAEARQRDFPIVGPEVGRVFAQLAALHDARRVLELGSGFGYSALWWSIGAPKAEVHLTEFKEENLRKACAYAEEAGVAQRWHCHTGDALETVAHLQGPWDIVFCDIDKESYPVVLDFAEKALRPGDLLVFDNMLWHGRVVQPESEQNAGTRAVIATTRRIYDSGRWQPSLLPARDGVLVAIRR